MNAFTDGSERRRLVAHRGRIGNNVENSIGSLALIPSDIGGVEIDVRLTKDGCCVLMHDATLERTTNSAGSVADITSVELRSCRLNDGTTVPELSKYLEIAASQIDGDFYLDIKDGADAVHEVSLSVLQSPHWRRCVLLVKDIDALSAARVAAPNMRLGLLRIEAGNIDERMEWAEQFDVEILFLMHGDDTYLKHRHVIPKLLSSGMSIGASSIHTQDVLSLAIQDQCSKVLTSRIFKR